LILLIAILPILGSITDAKGNINLSNCSRVKNYGIYSPDFGTDFPYGYASVIVTVCKLYETDNSNDYYFYYIRFQVSPGNMLWSSGWVTSHTKLRHDVYNPGYNRFLWDYSPSNIDAHSGNTRTVSLHLSISNIGWSYSESYSIKYIRIIDYSSFELHRVFWDADYNEVDSGDNDPPRTSSLLKYSFIVRVYGGACSFVDAKYSVTWAQKVFIFYIYRSFWTDNINLDLCPY